MLDELASINEKDSKVDSVLVTFIITFTTSILLAECLTKVPLTVSGNSSVYRNDFNNWGPHLALTPVSNTWTGYWHSADHDYSPWIAFKMAKPYQVAVVVLDDRKGCCHERFANVKVTVGPSQDIDDEDNISCGTKSYQADGVTTYK